MSLQASRISIFLPSECNTPCRPPPRFPPRFMAGGCFEAPISFTIPAGGVPSSSRVRSRAPRVVTELQELAWEPRRDRGGQCPARRQMGISAHAKKHQQAPRTAFVTGLSRGQAQLQLSASQRRVPGCEGSALAPPSGWGGGERAADGERAAPPGCPSHPAAHHPHLRPPHRPGISRQDFPWDRREPRGKSTKKIPAVFTASARRREAEPRVQHVLRNENSPEC